MTTGMIRPTFRSGMKSCTLTILLYGWWQRACIGQPLDQAQSHVPKQFFLLNKYRTVIQTLGVQILLRDTIPVLIRIFFCINPPLPLLVYSFAKLIPYFELVSYKVSTITQSRTESENSGHSNWHWPQDFQLFTAYVHCLKITQNVSFDFLTSDNFN